MVICINGVFLETTNLPESKQSINNQVSDTGSVEPLVIRRQKKNKKNNEAFNKFDLFLIRLTNQKLDPDHLQTRDQVHH